jgi:hypothetical protein
VDAAAAVGLSVIRRTVLQLPEFTRPEFGDRPVNGIFHVGWSAEM